jgi:hypothetical protein
MSTSEQLFSDTFSKDLPEESLGLLVQQPCTSLRVEEYNQIPEFPDRRIMHSGGKIAFLPI